MSTYGESHCRSVGCIVDGCPPGLSLTEQDIQPQLTRRRPGQSAITTSRSEKDRVSIQSGTEAGITLGTPIGMMVMNDDQRPADYEGSTIDAYPRPSHADWTYLQKYGIKASSGGGRSSARETIGRVAAGAVADKYLKLAFGVEITAFVCSVGDIHLFPQSSEYRHFSQNPAFHSLIKSINREAVDSFEPVRSPDAAASARMERLISYYKAKGDSIGGTITCVVRNVPAGLGEPCFDKLEAMLAQAILSIPATKGIEFGSGFGGCEMSGSTHNDLFTPASPHQSTNRMGFNEANTSFYKPLLATKTNFSGGIQGGISNGDSIYFRVAFKPPATISQPQRTATYDGSSEGILEAKGRHDPCLVPRAVPVIEAMAALVLMDAVLAQLGRRAAGGLLSQQHGLDEVSEV
ncbi:hypothetical protein NM208_g4809 [Fusarium decemcellulare]|uniref:Uncharacterized protein n=1 Tax=Fusarium decemcellulare TaxID=57161 RepID=A0ACC1SJ90_9HYPO|nr:hypothetical protein NM208_g4809 [Fusarium decemcellulare]